MSKEIKVMDEKTSLDSVMDNNTKTDVVDVEKALTDAIENERLKDEEEQKVKDDNGIRYGDRTLTLFKKGLGFDNVPLNFWEGRKKYPHLYIGDDVFSTFVGDFTIDFGPIVAFILFSIASVFFCKKTSAYKGIIPFHRFILLFIIFDICTDGAMFLFPYGYLGNLTLIFYILVILFFKLDYLSQKKNHKYE